MHQLMQNYWRVCTYKVILYYKEIETVLKQIKETIKKKNFIILKNNKRVENPKYSEEILYVFVPRVKLFDCEGKKEIVDMYTKFNVIDLPNGKRTVVISFHKLNKQIVYLFK